MTHTFPFHGSLVQFYEVLRAEYHRLTAALGHPPFDFDLPNQKIIAINEYIPKNGDEIMITFWDYEHKKELLVVEAKLLPDEDKREVLVFVHPQGNPFVEPVKSVMSIWKEIKKALKKAEKRRVVKKSKNKKKRKPHESTLIALDNLREIYSKALKNKKDRLTREDAAEKAGIAINTWREHDLELWNHWEDDGY